MTPRTLLAPGRLAGQSVLRSQADERLVDLALAGSTPAFEAIVARYRGPLLGYCGRILDEGRAEDAVQQTFMKAARRPGPRRAGAQAPPLALPDRAQHGPERACATPLRADEPLACGRGVVETPRTGGRAPPEPPRRPRGGAGPPGPPARRDRAARARGAKPRGDRTRARCEQRGGAPAPAPGAHLDPGGHHRGDAAGVAWRASPGPLADAPAARFAELCGCRERKLRARGEALHERPRGGCRLAGGVHRIGRPLNVRPTPRPPPPASAGGDRSQPRDRPVCAPSPALRRRRAPPAGGGPPNRRRHGPRRVRKQAAAGPAGRTRHPGGRARAASEPEAAPTGTRVASRGHPRRPDPAPPPSPVAGTRDPGAGGHEMRAEPGIAPPQPRAPARRQDQATVIFP